jgi:hypothetical protein
VASFGAHRLRLGGSCATTDGASLYSCRVGIQIRKTVGADARLHSIAERGNGTRLAGSRRLAGSAARVAARPPLGLRTGCPLRTAGTRPRARRRGAWARTRARRRAARARRAGRRRRSQPAFPRCRAEHGEALCRTRTGDPFLTIQLFSLFASFCSDALLLICRTFRPGRSGGSSCRGPDAAHSRVPRARPRLPTPRQIEKLAPSLLPQDRECLRQATVLQWYAPARKSRPRSAAMRDHRGPLGGAPSLRAV